MADISLKYIRLACISKFLAQSEIRMNMPDPNISLTLFHFPRSAFLNVLIEVTDLLYNYFSQYLLFWPFNFLLLTTWTVWRPNG